MLQFTMYVFANENLNIVQHTAPTTGTSNALNVLLLVLHENQLTKWEAVAIRDKETFSLFIQWNLRPETEWAK